MNNDVVICLENVSKQYRLGLVGSGTISDDINRWWAKIRGKEDPALNIGEPNDPGHKGKSEYVWALQNINLEVNRGEVLGIIGKNGAGKSTLLKILSRVTTPTTGQIKVKGRIASLLEVGTGFHPELTGMENIYLNGSIMGMTRSEISRKRDEIVDFSGCERYIDTPVKRYSSGMRVRLGFAVAAHLEPEILIIDEVLAVGDAEFQQKCLGKMGAAAQEGRTVLFVSHNMASVNALCKNAILLENGGIVSSGTTEEITSEYLEKNISRKLYYTAKDSPNKPHLTKIELKTSECGNIHMHGTPMEILFYIKTPRKINGAAFSFQIIAQNQTPVAHFILLDSETPMCRTTGSYLLTCKIPKVRLYPGRYSLTIYFFEHLTGEKIEQIDLACPFEVLVLNEIRDYHWRPGNALYVEDSSWSVNKLDQL